MPSAASDPSVLTATITTHLDLGRAPAEYWQRIALLPGLELLVRTDAPQAARIAARRICDEYVVK
jgi:hypothetical protein